ncbi:ArgE/DapE family deacylase [Candidatus Bathyarchaeota archaeon]|nr:ArgE/DapE family deacylase [Candidatus Bathyarchaeota archaeon]MBL7079921.1 ArgE/DapE family deacylase [Candidatus Bathyarchaeota archaeon]
MNLINRILKQVDENEDEGIGFLRSLVKIPTQVPPGENYDKITKLIVSKLEGSGCEARQVITPKDFVREHYPRGLQFPRVSALGRLKGKKDKPSLIFSGHIDTVPVDQGWTVDPFCGEIIDGSIWGRGASDNKGGVAAITMAVKAINDLGIKLNGDLIIAATPDEEVGGRAGPGYLTDLGLLFGDFCMIADGPMNYIGITGQGSFAWEVNTYGKATHSSIPWKGVNAIDGMANIVLAIRDHAEVLHRRVTDIPAPSETGRDYIYPTVNTGIISGGVKENMVPDKCSIRLYRRITPDENLEKARQELIDVIETAVQGIQGLTWDYDEIFCKVPWRVPGGADNDVVKQLELTAGEILGREVLSCGMTGASDAEHFYRHGISACCLGPSSPGNNTHGLDEHMPIKDLTKLTKIYASMAVKILGA